MNEHHTPRETNPLPEEEDYIAYPQEHAVRKVTVPRNANPETGEPRRLEGGWIIVGETTDNEKYVVKKFEENGNELTKRINKGALDELQDRLFQDRNAEREAAESPTERLRRRLGDVASNVVRPAELITADQVPAAESSEAAQAQAPAEELPEHETHRKFWDKHRALVENIDRAIEKSGHVDPSMLAYNLAADIESIRQITGLHADMLDYLRQVIDVCNEVGESGRNQRSPYYRNGRAGLQRISAMIRAIK